MAANPHSRAVGGLLGTIGEGVKNLPITCPVPYSGPVREAPSVDLSSLAPSLGECCHGYLDIYRARFEKAVRQGEPGVTTAGAFARALDGLLSALYCAASAAAGPADPQHRVALVAVGGYGRSLVGLHSDVDVLFLCDDPDDPRARALAEGLLYPLWDLGMEIGHAVRGQEETLALAREDIRTATTLIDLRRVAGDASIVADLQRGARRAVFEPHLDSFLSALENDTERRHERFGDSLYLLEPEVKQGRGGLRDLDVAEWAARARWDARTTQDYVRTGALLQREVEELDAAREMLWRVRNQLHLRARRQQDRLTFADQEEIAAELGFVDGITLGVEQFMQAYYRHAQTVAQTAQRMLARARPQQRKTPATMCDLSDGTAVFDGQITLVSTKRLSEEPALALRLYSQVSQRHLPPYPYARDAIARIAVDNDWREQLRASEEATRLFLHLLTARPPAEPWERGPMRRKTLLSEIHEVGLTIAMVPELEPLTGRVQHDVFHVYTTDIHAVRATDRLRGLFAGKRYRNLGLASRMAAEAPRPLPLFMATFLHALGKVHGHNRGGGRDRSGSRSAAMVRPVLERLGLPPVDVEHVVWLLQEQGSLYHWATRRDTSDPDTLAELAKRVGTVERLNDLYLMTVAILSTVNPRSLSGWTARMLEDLVIGLTGALHGRGETAAGRAVVVRQEAKVGFVGDREEEVLSAFLDRMPDRYVLSNPVDVLRRHARAFRDGKHHSKPRGLTVALGPGPSEEVSEILVITPDRPGLLADVCAVFEGHRVTVVDAQIYTLRGGDSAPDYAVDAFAVQRESGGRLDRPLRGRIEADLAALLDGSVSAQEIAARAPARPAWARRPGPQVETDVCIDNEASPRFTVIDVHTRDRPGVLHAIARTLHVEGLTIALSKISTEGDRVTDVFYVREASQGSKLSDVERIRSLAAKLESALARV